MAGLEETLNGKRFTWNSPLCVLIVTYGFDALSRVTCWYAWARSNLLNFWPLVSFSNKSSNFGIGYCSSLETKLVVSTNAHRIIRFQHRHYGCCLFCEFYWLNYTLFCESFQLNLYFIFMVYGTSLGLGLWSNICSYISPLSLLLDCRRRGFTHHLCAPFFPHPWHFSVINLQSRAQCSHSIVQCLRLQLQVTHISVCCFDGLCDF